MSRRPHEATPYDSFSNHSGRSRARPIEFQDDSLSSINSDEDPYLQQKDKKCTRTRNKCKSYKERSPDGTSERLARLESMLETLVKRKEESPLEDKRAFGLEPRRHDFTTSMWLNRIQETSIQNNWDEKTTISYMGSQMCGIIKAWYKCLPTYDYTWPEWKILISKTFPDNTDFVTSLKRLVTRLRQVDETMDNYYFGKMYLIEACKISGADAVSCLIDGLNNQVIQEQAKALNCLTPETLYSQFLVTLPEYALDYASSISSDLNNWIGQRELTSNPDDLFDMGAGPREEFGYKPEEQREKRSVHTRLDKRFIRTNKHYNKVPLAARLCTICGKRGHLARQCRNVEQVLCCKTTQLKYTKCIINNRNYDSLIDTACTTVAIKNDVALKLQLHLVPSAKTIQVYGGSTVRVLAETEVSLQVGGVQSQVKAVVVPNHVQDVPVLIGQEFLKNVCAVFHRGNVKIFKAN